jgi:hypothetical protein
MIMKKGELNKKECIAALVTIIILASIGAWVYHMTPESKKNQRQERIAEIPSSQEREKKGEEMVQELVFQPLGTSSIAVKLSSNYLISPTEVPVNDTNHYKVLVEEKNTDDSYLIEIITMAAITKGCSSNPCPGFLSEEEYFEMKKSYQESGFSENELTFTYQNRVYNYSQLDTPTGIGRVEYLRTFFGDTYLMQISHIDNSNLSQTPSEQLESFMNTIQFSSKFLSRDGVEQVFKRLFAEKNLIDDAAVSIEKFWITENHSRGEVVFTTDRGKEAGLFFAVKEDNKWVLVFEGNGSYKCSVLDFHAFPKQMQEGCR